jgi:hypothetical protein
MPLHPDQNATVLERAFLEHEVTRIIDVTDASAGPLRVLGSLGVSIHCPDASSLLPAFARTYADIDFAAYRRHAKDITAALAQLGYVEDREVFIASEGRRGLYDNPTNRVHVDVFFDRLEFCHPIPLQGRLEHDRPTVPLAELLLSKLQIVKINEKDVVDVILLLLDHRLGAGDDDMIDEDRVASLCAADWGLWRTVTNNLDKVTALAHSYPQLDGAQRARVESGVAALVERLDREPKSFGWRARARVGERKQWWTDVDEVR